MPLYHFTGPTNHPVMISMHLFPHKDVNYLQHLSAWSVMYCMGTNSLFEAVVNTEISLAFLCEIWNEGNVGAYLLPLQTFSEHS